ncbi:unnamed protein product, partial [Dibothriocephalus latus]
GKHERKFTIENFWGIIRGVRGDYYIAQGVGQNCMTDMETIYRFVGRNKYFLSKDCISWVMMPVPSQADIEKSKYFKMRFTGDPSYEFEHTELTQVPGEGDEINEKERTITMKEEDRLAAVVKRIDDEVRIVPRGAYLRLANGDIVKNKMYEGMEVADAMKAASYFHFRPPIKYPHKPLEDKVKSDRCIDFLDTIENDIPKGCWILQCERGGSIIFVKSLTWIGYVLFHVPRRPIYGSLYVGTGEYNIDLPFML